MIDRAERAVTEWKKEWPTLDAAPMALGGRLLEAAQQLDRHWNAPLARQLGLQTGEFDVLATLRRAGAPYALTPGRLNESLMLSSGAMTNRLDRLEQKGLITRTHSPEDRRSVQVQLSDEGQALTERMMPQHVDNLQQAFSALTAEEQRQLSGLLCRLSRSLSAP